MNRNSEQSFLCLVACSILLGFYGCRWSAFHAWMGTLPSTELYAGVNNGCSLQKTSFDMQTENKSRVWVHVPLLNTSCLLFLLSWTWAGGNEWMRIIVAVRMCAASRWRAGKPGSEASSSVMNGCFSQTSISRHVVGNMLTAWMIHAQRLFIHRHFEKHRNLQWSPYLLILKFL